MNLEEWAPFTRAQGGRSARFGNYPHQFHINYIIKGKKLLGNELMATFDLTDCKVVLWVRSSSARNVYQLKRYKNDYARFCLFLP